ncbi:hypothetical protein OHB53_11195 [Streptomyces sp. NBC_00056]|uniref:hypothetical protein n=1 Tax=Streptomyces sp. NBC_00056 TaxID=2975633 RepID=UPI00325482A8
MLSYSVKRLCTAHYQRWVQAGRPEFEVWVPGEDAYHRHHRVIRGCAVAGCRRSMNGCSPRICTRHTELWQAAGAPDLDAWLATTRYEAPPHGERDCVLPDCPWWTTGPGSVLCRRHYIRWRNNGHPELPDDQLIDWFARLELRRDPYIRFHNLGRQVRLEVQFGSTASMPDGQRSTGPASRPGWPPCSPTVTARHSARAPSAASVSSCVTSTATSGNPTWPAARSSTTTRPSRAG